MIKPDTKPVEQKWTLKRALRRFLFKIVLEARAKRLARHIMESLDDCSNLIDFGCGDMILTECLHGMTDKEVVGVDTVNSNLTRLPLILYDGNRLPFDDKSIDAALVAFVLHHCSDIEKMLAELKRVTRKKIIVFEEVYQNLLSQKILHCHDFGNRLLSSKMEIPLNFLTHDKWIQTFREHNLSVNKSFRIYQYPPPMMNLTHQIFFELGVD